MTLPMTASLSASELVSEATWFSRLSTVPPSPWKTWMISKETRFMSAGDSACSSGRNPPNSVVRSSAGLVWASGMRPPSAQGPAAEPVALGQRDVALADEVAVLDRRLDRRGQRDVGAHLELDLGGRPVLLGRSSPMPVTWPTRTPAMRTSSPFTSPATSVNWAR